MRAFNIEPETSPTSIHKIRAQKKNLMSTVILTGPAAAGKSTIANALAQIHEKAAVIDVDIVRWMYRKPHFAPWEGDQGIEQMRIGAEHACMLARSFSEHGLPVFISDVVLNETIEIYQAQLQDYALLVVQLMPSWDVSIVRLRNRTPTISEHEAMWVYEAQKKLTGYDYRLDSSTMTVEETVGAVRGLLTL